MAAAAVSRQESDAFVHLAAATPLHVDPDRIAELIAGDDCPWPGGEVALPAVAGMRRYAVDLRLRMGGAEAGWATFSKAAFVELGPPRRTGSGWDAEISWRAASAAPLFPVFSGRLIVEPHQLRVEGLYAPPGGAIGRAADRMLLHVAANGTARWLLGELDRAARGAAG